MVADPGLSDTAMREQLQSVLATHRARRPAARAQLVRERLIDGVRPVRALLGALVQLPWQATDAHPVLAALRWLHDLYAYDQRRLPADVHVSLGRVWQAALASPDRERALCAFEVATQLGLRRALRNGTVWIDHSLAFRSREQLLIPAARWHAHRRAYFRRLGLPTDATRFLEPLAERAQAGLAAAAAAAEAVNALKRAIYAGRVPSHQAKRPDEMQAVADALSLLANILMAWNTAQMQQVLDHWAQRGGGAVPPELIGRIAPTRTEGINLRGVFRFPVERYADKILPSAAAEKTRASAL